MSDVERKFIVNAGLDEAMSLDLVKVLGPCKVRRDWKGTEYFMFPKPFEHLHIYNRETLSLSKKQKLGLALEYFAANPVIQE